MPVSPFSPELSDFAPVFYLNGNLIDKQNTFITGEVTFKINELPMAVFTFSNIQRDLSEIIKSPSEKYDEIEVRNSEDLIFKGYIRSKSLRIQDGNTIVDFNCADLCEKSLALPALSKIPSGSLKDFIETQLGMCTVKYLQDFSSHIQLEGDFPFYQNSISRWQYVVNLLSFFGGAVILQNGELILMGLSNENPANTFSIGTENQISSLHLKLNSDAAYKKVKIEYWDSQNQEAQSVETEGEPHENTYFLRLGETTLNEEALQFHAESIQQNSKLKTASGTLKTVGNTLVEVGDYIQFSPSEYIPPNSCYLVTGTEHTLTKDSWETLYRIGLDEDEEISSALNVRQKENSTMYIGKVVETENDPDGEFRVKVNLPALENREFWGRILNITAGNGYGSYFIPKVGSEVVVSFMGDFNDIPIVLGSLYSSANPPPFNGQNKSGIMSKEGNGIIFNGDDQSIEISTRNGTSIVLSDEQGIQMKDLNNNLLLLNSDGIMIDSYGTSFKISYLEGIEAKTDGAKLSMNQNLKMSSDSLLEINSARTLNLKGSIININ